MPRKLKIYSMTIARPAGLTVDQPDHVRQVTAVVATNNQAEAAEKFGTSVHHFRLYGHDPDQYGYDFARAEPGTVFYAPLDRFDAQWVRADGTPAVTDTAPDIPESEVNAAARELMVITCNADFTTNHTANDQVRRQWDRGGFHADVVTGFKDRARAVLAAVQEVRP